MQNSARGFPYEDLVAGCVALVAAVVCALALFDVPAATATRGVSYADFVRAPTIERPLPATVPVEQTDRPRVADLPLEIPASDLVMLPNACSPDTRAELQRLLDLCQG
jgi:hypothetical protein